ncbi:MAG TPA: DUF2807 domain-containing protein [Rhizomicrobium sp.]|nr:DUF2807 domain-containing protein [Rhizomicrobium sp.]
MRNPTQSMLIGAAVAALLVLPASGADSGWVTWPTKSFATKGLDVEDVVGDVRVTVQDGPMKLDVSGSKELVAGLTVRNEGGSLTIDGSNSVSYNVWDWRHWFDFSHINDTDHGGHLSIKVTVPKGTPVKISDLIGNAAIGDTYGPVDLESVSSNATIGKVTQAKISLGGSGKIAVADVSGDLELDIAGSGRITAGHAGNVRADIAGSGDAQIGSVSNGVTVDIAGSGDFTAAKVNGPVHVDIAGSGNVKIADGVADPLKVDILGAGDLYFGGVAVNPSISAMGSGNVHLKSYRGKLSNDGMADVRIDETAPPGQPGQPPAPGHHSDDDDDDN